MLGWLINTVQTSDFHPVATRNAPGLVPDTVDVRAGHPMAEERYVSRRPKAADQCLSRTSHNRAFRAVLD